MYPRSIPSSNSTQTKHHHNHLPSPSFPLPLPPSVHKSGVNPLHSTSPAPYPFQTQLRPAQPNPTQSFQITKKSIADQNPPPSHPAHRIPLLEHHRLIATYDQEIRKRDLASKVADRTGRDASGSELVGWWRELGGLIRVRWFTRGSEEGEGGRVGAWQDKDCESLVWYKPS